MEEPTRVRTGRQPVTDGQGEESPGGVNERCELCRREVPELTRHHLVPRMRHRKRSALKRFDLDQMRSRVAMLCRPCHKQVHVLFSERDLERAYYTLDLLRAHPDMGRFLDWIRDKPGNLRVSTYRGRPRGRR